MINNKLTGALSLSFFLGLGLISAGFATLPDLSQNDKLQPKSGNIIANTNELMEPAPVPVPAGPVIVNHVVKIDKGDTLAEALHDNGMSSIEVALAIEEIGSVYDLRKLRAGQEIDITTEEFQGNKQIKALKFQPSIEEIIELGENTDGSFFAKSHEIPLKEIKLKAEGKISGSLYQSALDAGIEQNVLGQLIAAFSFVVDFQRDIKEGDEFVFLFEALQNEQGEIVKGRRPIYAKLVLSGKPIEIFAVKKEDGTLAYYHGDGSSIRKGLLRTPIDGARITSGFGMRRHPILGYSKMHKGADFGAPTGTPIYAAGTGVIDFAGRKGGYGNYVKVKHNKSYSTAYAHCSRFAKGIKNGVKVSQGQVIAYVGTTGRSTGPHLHYEVIKDGTQINPTSAKFQIADKLEGKKLQQFKADIENMKTSLATTPTKASLAQTSVVPAATPPQPFVTN